MAGFMCWLEANHDALQTMAAFAALLVTLAGVGAALYYAWLTRRLVNASSMSASAAADQATITRRTFEAVHRPYVEAAIDPWRAFYREDHFRLTFVLRNHGQVPAALAGWSAVVVVNGHIVFELFQTC